MYFKVVTSSPAWPEALKDFSFIFTMRTMDLPQVKLIIMRGWGWDWRNTGPFLSFQFSSWSALSLQQVIDYGVNCKVFLLTLAPAVMFYPQATP